MLVKSFTVMFFGKYRISNDIFEYLYQYDMELSHDKCAFKNNSVF